MKSIKISISVKIIIGMLAGILLGYILYRYQFVAGEHDATRVTQVNNIIAVLKMLSKVFLRLIKMIIAPLVLSILTVGIAKIGDIKSVGRIGVRTLGYFYGATVLSLVTGLISVNIFQPGSMLNLELPAKGADTGLQTQTFSLEHFIEHIFPQSIIEAMAKNEVLGIVVFAIFFGISIASLGDKEKVLVKPLEVLSDSMFKIIGYIMNFAPYAVFGAVATVLAEKGPEVLKSYGYLVICFFATLLFFVLIVLSGICLIFKIPYVKVMTSIGQAMMLSFGTSSSEVSMPLQLERLKELGIPERIVSFVLPLGYSFNLDGSMIYMTFATGFIAQAYHIELSLAQQLMMMLTLLLTSKGIAGVPRASLVVIAGTLSMFGLPVEGLVLLFGVDWLLDMGRSATSVAGNAVAAAVVAKWEGISIK
jgi:Na+/H+-dicarboxylate symporter